MESGSSPSSEPKYHGFWPVFLIGLSFTLVLAWEIQVGVYTRRNTELLRAQQLRAVDQAKKVQSELEKIVRGLVELAKTDDAAAKIVTKYGIKLTNPAMPTGTPAP